MDGDSFFKSSTKVAKKQFGGPERTEGRGEGRGRGRGRGRGEGRGRGRGRGEGRGRGRGRGRGDSSSSVQQSKRKASTFQPARPRKQAKKEEEEEESTFNVFEENAAAIASSDSEDEFEQQETADQKRHRLAKALIASVEAEEADRADDEELLKQAVAHRLKSSAAEDRGVLTRELAQKLADKRINDDATIQTRGHRLPVTCVALAADGASYVTTSKDGSMIKWNEKGGTAILLSFSVSVHMHAGTKVHHWKRLTDKDQYKV